MSSSVIWHTAGPNILNYSDKMANTSSGWNAVRCLGRLKHLFSPTSRKQAHLKMESAGRLSHRKPPDRLHKHCLAKWAQWEILSNVLKWSVEKKGRDSIILMSRLQWVWGVDFYAAQCGGGMLGGYQPQMAAVWISTSLSEWHHHTERETVSGRSALIHPVYLCQCLSASSLRSTLSPVKNVKLEISKTSKTT